MSNETMGTSRDRSRPDEARPAAWQAQGTIVWIAAAGLLGLLACLPSVEPGDDAVQAATRHAGTETMASRLQAVAQQSVGRDNAFTPQALVELYAQIEEPPDVRSQVQLRARRAQAFLFAGHTAKAVDAIEEARELTAQRPELFKPAFVESLRSLAAIAHLRLGEQENCVHGGAASCLFPITVDGVHSKPRGALRAMELYGEILDQQPDDLEARWLLNLAAMAAGRYPDGLPPSWVMAPNLFVAEEEIDAFEDRAPALGLDAVGLSGGVVLEDFDGDGRLDVMVSSWGLEDPLRLFHQQPEGFVDISAAAGLEGLTGGLNLTSADYDNDGHVDVLVLRGAWMGERGRHPNSLLRNLGGMRFVDVTEESGLLESVPTQTAAWGDMDNDGWVDLFVGNETSGRHVHPCRLYRNRGDGTFEEVAEALGVDVVGYVKGVAWGDIDNDGLLDLYVSRLDGHNILFHNNGLENNGLEGFRDVTETAGVAEPRHSFPTWFFDYDNDGWLDLFVSGYPVDIFTAGSGGVAADYLGRAPDPATTPRLYRNHGDGTFDDVTVSAGLNRVLYTMGSNVGDVDNDGWPDLYLGTGAPDFRALMPNRLFRNASPPQGSSSDVTTGRRFLDVTSAARVGHLQKGHGVAFGDLDNDGDQDIHVVLGGAYSGDVFANAVFINPGTHDHRWLGLRLEGVASNRAGLGARIRLKIRTDAGQREIHHWVFNGSSFGAASYRREIGLGKAEAVELLEVRWPSGQIDRISDVLMDRFVQLREGTGVLKPLPAPRFAPSFRQGSSRVESGNSHAP